MASCGTSGVRGDVHADLREVGRWPKAPRGASGVHEDLHGVRNDLLPDVALDALDLGLHESRRGEIKLARASRQRASCDTVAVGGRLPCL